MATHKIVTDKLIDKVKKFESENIEKTGGGYADWFEGECERLGVKVFESMDNEWVMEDEKGKKQVVQTKYRWTCNDRIGEYWEDEYVFADTMCEVLEGVEKHIFDENEPSEPLFYEHPLA